MTFFEKAKSYVSPRLSDSEVNDMLNAFEIDLFGKHPEALLLGQIAQDEFVLTAWEKHWGSK